MQFNITGGQEDYYFSTTNSDNKLETIRTWFGYDYVIVLVFDIDINGI